MNNFETHVYATVRVKVLGTNVSDDPQVIAEKVADAVCAKPGEWMHPVHGSVDVAGYGRCDIEAVEFGGGIHQVLVDELDPESGNIIEEHCFDEICSPIKEAVKPNSAAMIERVALLKMVNDLDEYLRQIRAENLDGSEPALGDLLERSLDLRLAVTKSMPDVEIDLPEDDWRRGVIAGSTVYWKDPDRGISSGYYQVAYINTESRLIEYDDSLVTLKNKAGSECEVLASELLQAAPQRKPKPSTGPGM